MRSTSEACAHVRELTDLHVRAARVEQIIGHGIVGEQKAQLSPALAGWVIRIEVVGNIPLCQELSIDVHRLCHDAKLVKIFESSKFIHI